MPQTFPIHFNGGVLVFQTPGTLSPYPILLPRSSLQILRV